MPSPHGWLTPPYCGIKVHLLVAFELARYVSRQCLHSLTSGVDYSTLVQSTFRDVRL